MTLTGGVDLAFGTAPPDERTAGREHDSAGAATPASECAHCELPVGRYPVRAVIAGAAETFCCYGCVLAMQVTRGRGESGAAAAILVRLGLAIFFTMNVMVMTLPTYSTYLYGEATAGGSLFRVLDLLAMLLATPVLLLLGGPILAAALRGMRDGTITSDALIVLGTFAAYGLSVAHIFSGEGALYFDTAAVLLVVVTAGRYLEAQAKAQATQAVRDQLAGETQLATRIVPGTQERVPADELLAGDRIRVTPGEAFPADGVIEHGCGGVDEAALTGESAPVAKAPGSAVAGGTCSIDGSFTVRLTARMRESAAARIAALLAAARRERAPSERAADAAARFFVPAVAMFAAATGVFWANRAGFDQGLLNALSVLVVACPCALGIATPVAVRIALASAARRGIIVRSGEALERAATIRRIVFDKTGTLTPSAPSLISCEPAHDAGLDATQVLCLAAALEQGLPHPVARALEAEARRSALPLPAPDHVRVLPGQGVHGEIGGRRLSVGSHGLAATDLGHAAVDGIDSAAVLVWEPGRLLGTLRFAEMPRPESAETVQSLRNIGVSPRALSGDKNARAITPALFKPGEVAFGLSPEGKAEVLRTWRTEAGGPIAMVGDGINDAPALASADIGMAFGDAADLARMTADVVILSGDLGTVSWFLVHARRAARVIRQNLIWAFGYNALAVVAAAAGWLTPVIASLAMLASSLTVIANSRRLRDHR